MLNGYNRVEKVMCGAIMTLTMSSAMAMYMAWRKDDTRDPKQEVGRNG
jgi:hypothetical protein